jgi:NADH:ubiquinone oxidoreductase subunit C
MEQAQVVKVINEQCPGAITEEQPKAVFIKKEVLLNVAKLLKNSELAFQSLHCVTAVDRKDKIEMVYHFYSFRHRYMLTLKANLSMEDLTIETLAHEWRSADWLEREVYDLFGVKFLNHPDLRRILNPDEWTDFPLRKSFDRPDFYRLPEVEGLKGGA